MSLEISAETSFALDLTNAIQYGPELHTDANAASDPNGNEADATTGWTPTSLTGTGSNVFESQSSVVNTGTYALYADCNDTPTGGARFSKTFTVENGSNYKVTFKWRHVGVGANWNVAINSIGVLAITNTQTIFESFSHEFTATSTSATVQFGESNPSNDGGIYVDNLSFRKIL